MDNETRRLLAGVPARTSAEVGGKIHIWFSGGHARAAAVGGEGRGEL